MEAFGDLRISCHKAVEETKGRRFPWHPGSASLGNWDVEKALQLHTDKETHPKYSVDLLIRPGEIGQSITYNYFVRSSQGTIEWEEGQPRVLQVVSHPPKRGARKHAGAPPPVPSLFGYCMAQQLGRFDCIEHALAVQQERLKQQDSFALQLDMHKKEFSMIKRQMTDIRSQSSAPTQNEQALGVSELAQKMQDLSSSLSSRMLQLESSMAVLQPTLSVKETATADIGKECGHGDLDIDEASPQLAQVCKQTDSDKEKLEALEALEAAGHGKSIGQGCIDECLAFMLCFAEVRRLISRH